MAIQQEDIHGHFVKVNMSDHPESFPVAIHHLKNLSYDAAEPIFRHAREHAHAEFVSGSHTFVLIPEANGYELKMRS